MTSPEKELRAPSVPPAIGRGAEGPADEGVLPGTRYQMLYLLGDGGAGQVYRARHLELDKPFAIKVLHADLSNSSDYAARFRHEAKAASSIQHPGVVSVTDFGVAADGRLFLVMELIEGPTLSEEIQRGPLHPRKALRIAVNLCQVLDAVHKAGIVHRDIKPANVFMVADDAVKLVDFGIARGGLFEGSDEKITRTGRVVGTPGYMAPEHARSKEIDGRADLYSLGAVLYEMLTGVPPFRGDSPVDVLMAQMTTSPTPPSKAARGRGITRAVDRVVLKLLARTPDERYQTAAVAARELERLRDNLKPSTQTVASGAVEPLPHRRLWSFAAIAIVLLSLVGGALGFWLLGRPQPTQQKPPRSPAPATSVAASSVPGASETVASAAVAPGRANLSPDDAVASESPDAGAPAMSAAASPDAGITASPAAASPDAGPAPRAEPSAPERTAREAPSAPASSPRGSVADGPSSPPSRAPGSGRELLQQARIAAASGRSSEAERLYERALAAVADRTAVQSGLGRIALARGQHVRAVRLLEEARRGRPGSLRLMLDLGRAYLGAGQRSRAIEQWRAVLARDPDNAHARRRLEAIGAL